MQRVARLCERRVGVSLCPPTDGTLLSVNGLMMIGAEPQGVKSWPTRIYGNPKYVNRLETRLCRLRPPGRHTKGMFAVGGGRVRFAAGLLSPAQAKQSACAARAPFRCVRAVGGQDEIAWGIFRAPPRSAVGFTPRLSKLIRHRVLLTARESGHPRGRDGVGCGRTATCASENQVAVLQTSRGVRPGCKSAAHPASRGRPGDHSVTNDW